MTDTTTGAPAPSASTVAPVNVQTDTGPITIREAAKQFAERRERGQAVAETPDPAPGETKPTEQPRVNGRFASAAAQTESTPTGDDAGPETVPSEIASADPAEQPSIEPPRSWSKEDKELFNALPRETQERVADRERSRESDFLRRQTEATEKSKALEAKEQAAEQARQQYESAAQNALQVLQADQAREFGDIKTEADIIKLSNDDPFRFVQWQARQGQIQRQIQEVQQLNQQREQEQAKTFDTWSKEQDKAFEGKFPEFTDPAKASKAREQIVSYLTKEVGVPENVLPKLWQNPLFRDAMFQRVIYEASRFHAAQQTAKSAAQRPVPQVQRPGTSSTKGERSQADVGALSAKLDGAKTIREQIAAAAALRAAKRSASAH